MSLKDKLLEKSKEAFIMALEIYNKPTIKYRVEGFSFFICNAWELMLKAYMIVKNGESSIYYKDNPNRTISLEVALKKVLTNQHDPIRVNLDKIIELRNISTHFVTEEYEMIYAPLFQATVINYTNKLLDYFDDDITLMVAQNFLTLSINMSEFNNTDIMARYSPEMASQLIKRKEEIDNSKSLYTNDKFCINVNHHYYITKDKKQATASFCIDSNATDNVKIVKELKDPSNTHRYTPSSCVEQINRLLKKDSIPFDSNSQKTDFNMYHFQLFWKQYPFLKGDEKYAYLHEIGNNPQHTYSYAAIDFIFTEIKKDPTGIIKKLKSNKAEKI